MSSGGKQSGYTFEEYLLHEETADQKSEFYDGEIFAMSGGTRDLNLIGTNVAGELRSALRGKDCHVFTSDLKIKIEKAGACVYPDGMVISGPEEYHKDRKDVVSNPKIVIEVLSESSASWDRGGKFRKYELLSNLQEYVLIEQEEPQVDMFRRNEEGLWVLERYNGLEAVVEFQSVGVSVPMKEIYYGVPFSG